MRPQSTLLKRSIRYAVMPEISSRFREFGFNFGYLSFLTAYLFSITRLLPAGHPYLNADNINRFGVRDVILEAYTNLKWSWKNIDQIVLFVLVSCAFLLLLAQLISILLFLCSYSGSAFATIITGLFQTTPPDDDLALIMLDRIFGVPNVFNSCIAQGVLCTGAPSALPATPWPIHIGLHALFQFYSACMLVVALLIILYYFFVVVAETAQTGSPFGRRFGSVYAPLRLVLAVALLLPLANGINTGQYLLLNVANWGSGLGTNGWKVFNISLTNALGSDAPNMIVKPNSPDLTTLVQFYHLVTSCRAAYKRVYDKDIQPYLYTGTASVSPSTFAAALAFYAGHKDIRIRYGENGSTATPPIHGTYASRIRPYCGEIVLSIDSTNVPFALTISEAYFDIMESLWNNTNLNQMAEKIAEERYGFSTFVGAVACPAIWGGGCTNAPPVTYLRNLISMTQTNLEATLVATLSPASVTGYTGFDYGGIFLDQGWGAAGLWFNKISEINGAIITATYEIPYGQDLPEVMEFVAQEKKRMAPQLFALDKYNPQLPKEPKDTAFSWQAARDHEVAGHLNEIYKVFTDDDLDPTPDAKEDSNPIGVILSTIFGADGLFDLRENNDVHPLAQMSGLGKSIIESAITNIGIGMTLSFGAGAASSANEKPASVMAEGFSGTFITIGSIALTTGFLLFYILPFLPFIYFFFAMGKWVKAIFEAMVAVPLWALAHLKIDGDGISGPAAKNGYVLLLEIFLRPILTVFGMLAAVSIFTAMAVVMNELFDLVAANLSGYDSYSTPGTYVSGTGVATFLDIEYYRSQVDQFFFTLLYVVLIYIMATSCFKLIDLVPNSILRWIGEGVESFGDKAEDAADNLIRYAAIGGGVLGGELTGALKDGAKGLGQVAGGAISPFK